MRQAGTIGAPLDAAISLGADGGSDSGLAETLKRYREELKDLFIVSDVAILGDAEAAEIRRQANGREDFAARRYLRARRRESRDHAGRASRVGREVRAMLEVLR